MIPFILLGMPRTGSSLLHFALKQHPQIKIYGELFHKNESERINTHFIDYEKEKIYYKGGDEDAIEFLKKYVWNEENKKFNAVGFKLFAERIECEGTKFLFKRLKAEIKNLHIIVIKRLNLLDVFVSRKKAEQSKIWNIDLTQKDLLVKYEMNIKPIHVSPENLMKFFNSYEEVYNFYKSFFSDLPYIEVIYEELITNFDEIIKKISNFLNINFYKLQQSLVKLNLKPHQEFIVNYSELKAFFKNTKYEHFFQRSEDLISPVVKKIDEYRFKLKDFNFIDVRNLPKDKLPHREENKWISKHSELANFYLEYFKDKNIKKILEFGIYGGSIYLFCSIFNPTKYVGTDICSEDIDLINDVGKIFGDKVKLYYTTSQDDKPKLREIIAKEFSNQIDIIIDDASHLFDLSLASFESSFPYLRPYGYYVIEDWGWSHRLNLSHYNPNIQGLPSLTNLAFLLIMALASHPEIIFKIEFIRPSLLVIQKGPFDIEDKDNFSIFKLININNKKSLIYLSEEFFNKLEK